jgi:hypothetical protein
MFLSMSTDHLFNRCQHHHHNNNIMDVTCPLPSQNFLSTAYSPNLGVMECFNLQQVPHRQILLLFLTLKQINRSRVFIPGAMILHILSNFQEVILNSTWTQHLLKHLPFLCHNLR